MGGFDEAKIAKAFGVSRDFEPMAVMALGYASENEQKSPPKNRRPINENFYFGKWRS